MAKKLFKVKWPIYITVEANDADDAKDMTAASLSEHFDNRDIVIQNIEEVREVELASLADQDAIFMELDEVGNCDDVLPADYEKVAFERDQRVEAEKYHARCQQQGEEDDEEEEFEQVSVDPDEFADERVGL